MRRFTLVVLLGTLPNPVGAGDIAKERRDAFAWLDSLGYPPLNKLEFIRVATGNYYGDDKPPTPHFRSAFLMEAKGKSFKLLGRDMQVHDFTKTTHEPPHRQVDYDFARLEAYSRAVIKSLERVEKKEKGSDDEIWKLLGGPPEQLSFFTLAWWCARHGHDDLAVKLYEHARQDRYTRANRGDPKDGKNVQERAADAIAHQDMWNAIRNFADAEYTRPQLLMR